MPPGAADVMSLIGLVGQVCALAMWLHKLKLRTQEKEKGLSIRIEVFLFFDGSRHARNVILYKKRVNEGNGQ